jgi:hypothetical protein
LQPQLPQLLRSASAVNLLSICNSARFDSAILPAIAGHSVSNGSCHLKLAGWLVSSHLLTLPARDRTALLTCNLRQQSQLPSQPFLSAFTSTFLLSTTPSLILRRKVSQLVANTSIRRARSHLLPPLASTTGTLLPPLPSHPLPPGSFAPSSTYFPRTISLCFPRILFHRFLPSTLCTLRSALCTLPSSSTPTDYLSAAI